MRLLEVLLTITVTILPIYISLRAYQKQRLVILSVLAALLISHLIFEGYRWQLLPAYLLSIILLFCIYKNYKFFKGGIFRKIISSLLFIIVLVPSWALPSMLPVFKIPEPTGEYNVGTQYIHLKTSREESVTEKPNDKRELMIKAWYPAILQKEQTEKYLNNGDRYSFAVKYGLPKTTFNYLDYVNTHTYSKAKVAKGKFPVLIFSHGSYSKASGYYALLEEIASHGYIILNINHTYESTGTLFPNGEIKYYNTAYDQKYNNQEMAEMVWNSTQEYFKAKNWEEEHIAVESTIKDYIAAEITERWSKDMSSVIDELTNWNSSTFLSNHIDLTKVGILGHSQGGAAAGQALTEDTRIKAAVNIDGAQWGTVIDTMMTKPFISISSAWPDSHPDFNKHAYHNGSTTDFYNAKILNSGHANFMDIPLMINLKMINQSGSINPNKASKITTDLVIDFFDKYLNNEPIDILSLQKKHQELEISMHKKSNSKK